MTFLVTITIQGVLEIHNYPEVKVDLYNDADQTMLMRKVMCPAVVRIKQNHVFSRENRFAVWSKLANPHIQLYCYRLQR